MMFLRDEMVPSEMSAEHYGFWDNTYEFWYLNLGYTADQISIELFGA